MTNPLRTKSWLCSWPAREAVGYRLSPMPASGSGGSFSSSCRQSCCLLLVLGVVTSLSLSADALVHRDMNKPCRLSHSLVWSRGSEDVVSQTKILRGHTTSSKLERDFPKLGSTLCACNLRLGSFHCYTALERNRLEMSS